jgi:uncharacterized membrane protein
MTYSDIRRLARENLAGNWKKSIGIGFMAALLGAAVAGSRIGGTIELDPEIMEMLPGFVLAFLSAWASIAGVISLAQFVIGGTVQLGYTDILLKQYDRKDFQFEDLFSQFHRFKQGFLQGFLRGLYVFLWSLLLVIPGIVKTYSYAMTPFIMADHPEMTAKEAIHASRKMMDGYKGHLFMLDLSFFGWSILAILSLGVGFLWLNPYQNAAHAAFYRELCETPRIEE